jgi:hypothetical protein
MNLAERVSATETVIARYRAKPFDWATTGTCIHLARMQMVAMGHKAPSVPAFRSAIGAGKALKRAGFDSLERLLDSLLPRIAPASMLVGDLALMEGEPPFDAIVIAAGHKVFGFHEEVEGLAVIADPIFKGAWRL